LIIKEFNRGYVYKHKWSSVGTISKSWPLWTLLLRSLSVSRMYCRIPILPKPAGAYEHVSDSSSTKALSSFKAVWFFRNIGMSFPGHFCTVCSWTVRLLLMKNKKQNETKIKFQYVALVISFITSWVLTTSDKF